VNDWKSIFSGNAESARDLVSELEIQGIRSFVDDKRGPVVTPAGSRANYSVVLVPPDEAQRASAVARDWGAQNRYQADSLARRLATVFKFSVIPPAVWVLAYLVLPGFTPTPSLGWLVAIWGASFVIIAQIENRRHHSERIRMPAT
jgi:hypothetical protein